MSEKILRDSGATHEYMVYSIVKWITQPSQAKRLLQMMTTQMPRQLWTYTSSSLQTTAIAYATRIETCGLSASQRFFRQIVRLFRLPISRVDVGRAVTHGLVWFTLANGTVLYRSGPLANVVPFCLERFYLEPL